MWKEAVCIPTKNNYKDAGSVLNLEQRQLLPYFVIFLHSKKEEGCQIVLTIGQCLCTVQLGTKRYWKDARKQAALEAVKAFLVVSLTSIKADRMRAL